MISVKHSGSFKNIEKFFLKSSKIDYKPILEKYGREGVAALRAYTPKDTGATANAWEYRINTDSKQSTIEWYNSNVVSGVNIAIILQYGHGTRNGGYVRGIDYINPALSDIFQRMAEDVWREVSQ